MDVTAAGITDWAEAFLAIGGALVMIGAGMRSMYRMARNIDSMVTEVRAHKEITAGVVADIAHLKDEVAAVKAEVKPNGGGSMRDAVNRIDSRLKVFEGRDYGRTAHEA